MTPIRRERSVIHPRWLRVRWGWGCAFAFVMLCSTTAFGAAWFGVVYVSFLAWLLYRGERDSGCPPSLRRKKDR